VCHRFAVAMSKPKIGQFRPNPAILLCADFSLSLLSQLLDAGFTRYFQKSDTSSVPLFRPAFGSLRLLVQSAFPNLAQQQPVRHKHLRKSASAGQKAVQAGWQDFPVRGQNRFTAIPVFAEKKHCQSWP